MSIVNVTIAELADEPVGRAVTVRGKELAADATVGDARALLRSPSVQLVPVLDGTAYAGAVLRDAIPDAAADDEPIDAYVGADAPTATASTTVGDALARLDGDAGRRLVVVAED